MSVSQKDALNAIALLQQFVAEHPDVAVPIPVPPTPIELPGHEVTEDPPLSVTTQATMFGLNWDGSNDTEDLDNTQADGNARGFFTDHTTGKPYVTHTTDLIGASLPREVLLSTFLGVDSWQAAGIDKIWGLYTNDIRAWVYLNYPMLDIDCGGKYTVLSVPLVDAGPSAVTHNGLDLTYHAAHLLNTLGSAQATYRVRVGTKVQTIRGWDWTLKKVIGS